MEVLDIEDVRSDNLEEWIKLRFAGSQVSFAKKYRMSQSELSELLSGKRVFGERKARKIEQLASMPKGFLDVDHKLGTLREEDGVVPLLKLHRLADWSSLLESNNFVQELKFDTDFIPCPSVCSKRAFAIRLPQMEKGLSQNILNGPLGDHTIVFCDPDMIISKQRMIIEMIPMDAFLTMRLTVTENSKQKSILNFDLGFREENTIYLGCKMVKAAVIGLYEEMY